MRLLYELIAMKPKRKPPNPKGTPENLSPRIAKWGETKKERGIRLTDTGYAGLKVAASIHGCSLSDFLEALGRLSPEIMSEILKNSQTRT